MSGEPTRIPAATIAPPAGAWRLASARRGATALARDPAVRAVARALVLSRLVVWAAGLVGALALGRRPGWAGFDPTHSTEPFGGLLNALLAPAARWDSVWFLTIAHHGYGDAAHTAFFPLYPLLARVAGWFTGSALIGGVLVSLACAAVGLVCVHRLAELELGRAAADRAVLLLAYFPMSFFLSAVYSESLFLAVSAGALLAARRERWALAAALAALGAATRSVGVVLLVPLAWIYLYGPRGEGARRSIATAARWRPRHPLERSALWLGLVPVGLIAYGAWLWAGGLDPLTPFQVQDVWYREFAGPFGAVIDGTVAAFDGARQLLSGGRSPIYFHAAGGDPLAVGAQNVMLFGFLLLGLLALAGALRRLPRAYGLWCVVALALPLSYPVGPQPLMSLPRFLLVLFPLFMWAGEWAGRGPRRMRWLLGGELALLALFTALFVRWTFVA